MALDRRRATELIRDIEGLSTALFGDTPGPLQKLARDLVMERALKELKVFLEDARPPRLFLMGRSGHGKSSLINALAGRQVAKTDPVRPTTPVVEPHVITFEERHAAWEVFDSRGIFDATRPEGTEEVDSEKYLVDEVTKARPDLLLHAISAPEIRTLAPDLKVYKRVHESLSRGPGSPPATLVVLTRVDTLEDTAEWPPEESTLRAGWIQKALDYTGEVLDVETQALDPGSPMKGRRIMDERFVATIPVKALSEKTWNIGTLSDVIGEALPDAARLDFYQAQGRMDQLRRLSDGVIRRCTMAAGTIGGTPVPIPDMVLLIPLQILMVALIGGLSCRPFSRETAMEYLGIAGIDVAGGIGFRELVRQAAKFLPAGYVVSGAVAAIATYSIGKAAEVYFFTGREVSPGEYLQEAVARARDWVGLDRMSG